MTSPTFSLTDILIRGRQTNSQVIVSGVPPREKKIGTPDRRLHFAVKKVPKILTIFIYGRTKKPDEKIN